MVKKKIFSTKIILICLLLITAVLSRYSIYIKDKSLQFSGNLVFTNGESIYTMKLPQFRKKRIFSLVKRGENSASIDSLSYSPDGRIVIFSKYNVIGDHRKLYSINITNEKYNLFLSREKSGLINPSFSPDGRSLAYFLSSGHKLCVLDLENDNKLTILTDNISPYCKPSWSWDSKKIVFEKDKKRSDGGIYIIDVETRDLQFITKGFYPTWFPDDKRILFAREGGFYSIDLETKEEKRVFPTSRTGRPVWSPDGRFFIYYLYTPDLSRLSDGFHIISVKNMERVKKFYWFVGEVYDISWVK